MKDAGQTVTVNRGHGDPLVVTATVVSVEHKQEPDFGGTRSGLSAHLQVGEPPHTATSCPDLWARRTGSSMPTSDPTACRTTATGSAHAT